MHWHVSQEGFNPKTKRYLKHMGTVPWIQTCFVLWPFPSLRLFWLLGGTLLVQHLHCSGMVWGPRLAPRNSALDAQVGGGRMEWRIELSFMFDFLQVCGCELTIVWSSTAGQGGNCGLHGKQGRKQNSRIKNHNVLLIYASQDVQISVGSILLFKCAQKRKKQVFMHAQLSQIVF